MARSEGAPSMRESYSRKDQTEVLDADMTPADVVFVLGSLTRFPTTIEIDKPARDYLLDSVLARIGGRGRLNMRVNHRERLSAAPIFDVEADRRKGR
jgi:hypothetical protein